LVESWPSTTHNKDVYFFCMLSKAVIPLQTLMVAAKEGDQKP